MGPPPDPEDMVRMLQNPQFASSINEALANPQLIDMMIQQNPLLREMGPQVRQMMQTPEFRRMMTDPEQLRNMMQMQRMFGGASLGSGGGNSAFPAPGVTDTTPGAQSERQSSPAQNQQRQQQQPINPFAAFGQGQGQANPFAALFNPGAGMFGTTPSQTPPATASAGQGTPTGNSTPGTGQQQNTSQSNQPQYPFPFSNLGQNPLVQNPQLFGQLLNTMYPNQGQSSTPGTTLLGQQQDPAQNPFAALLGPLMGDFGATQASQNPADTRPPEERYATQLVQLNEMGFHEYERNIEALQRAGGNVQGAVEYLLTH
jgi:ubiquilin